MNKSRSEYWRLRSIERRKDPAYREKHAEWFRRWAEEHGKTPERLARKATQMREYAKRPDLRERFLARWQVRRALKAGRLMRLPCEVCGAPKVQAHHDDYSQPLQVRWLCPKHHRAHHAKATKPA